MSKPEALEEAGGPEEGPFRLHFRALNIDGARKAFRLEMIYWQALEVLAAQQGRTLAGEIQARLANAPEQLNQSSVLRASVASDLLERWERSETQVLRPDWGAMIAALPGPAFLVTRRSVLLAVNEPLLSVLQGLRSEPGMPLNTLPGALNLTVQVPPSAVAELGSGARRFVLCTVAFGASGQRIACHARLIPVQGPRPDAANLLGFLETGRR